MPLFSSKFSPKKTPNRKASISLANKDLSPKRVERELGPEIGPVRLCLGDQEMIFQGGTWIPESGKAGGMFKENDRLKKEIRKLEEENNLLKLKSEVLLDMLTQRTVESHLQLKELEDFKSKPSRNKRTVA